MIMFSPPHPGEFVYETYLKPFNISQNEMADMLKVAHSTFNRLVRGDSNISPEMALRLSRVLGRTPESWLSMQSAYDLFTATRESRHLKRLKPFDFSSLSLLH